jgi:NADH dehydrogenase
MVVLVTGATGFLGRRVVQALLEQHHQVRCLVHNPGRERMFPDGSVEVHFGSVLDPHALAAAFYGLEAVVHLVGIIGQRAGATFDQVNRQGVANVVAAAKGVGVKHFLHVSAIGSAIGATNNPSYPYLHSKWQGEQQVVNSGLPYTILRPSVMFGPGDEFLNTLAALARVFPLVPVVGSGRNRFQPIAVEDVARCLVLALGRDDLRGKTIEIGGSQQLSYNDLMGIMARTLGRRRLYVHIPVWPMSLAVGVLQRVQPRPPVTGEQLRMLPIPNVAQADTVQEVFGFTPRPLEGNIDYVRGVSFGDGLKIVAGFMPSRIRDH